MDPYFKDYKEQEGKKVVTILHASTAVATAVLYKLGVDPNSAFFVLALVASAAAYGYWYLADAAVYREAAIRHNQKPADRTEQQARVFSRWGELQQHSQKRCFVSGLLAWAILLAGLTAAFVLDVGLLPGWFGGFVILGVAALTIRSLLADLKNHIEAVRAERAAYFE